MEKIEFDIFWSENIRKIEVRSDSLQNSCPKLVGLTPGRAIHFFLWCVSKYFVFVYLYSVKRGCVAVTYVGEQAESLDSHYVEALHCSKRRQGQQSNVSVHVCEAWQV